LIVADRPDIGTAEAHDELSTSPAEATTPDFMITKSKITLKRGMAAL
jgi:hypothetical protein